MPTKERALHGRHQCSATRRTMRDPTIDATSHGTKRTVAADRKTKTSTQASFADLDDIEQMVILLNMMLERQFETGRGNGHG